MGHWNDNLREEFRAAGLRLTSQRRLILDVLEETEDHLDAETLHERVRAHDPDVSLATVYRTLAVLKELGIVEEHRLGEGHAHYELVRERPHYHFVCRGCGQVIEFDAPEVALIAQAVSESENVQITGAHLRLSGYCARCQGDGDGNEGVDDDR